jgi:DNA polymerase (family X)
VASVHSHFGGPAERMTGRIAKALRSVVHVLGHPSGREIGKRDAYALDLEEVLEVAREQGVDLANLRFGVWVARRGWLEKGDVLNTLPLADLLTRLAHRPAARRSTPHMGGARLARFPRSPRSLT